jgi:Co/Zn/Cd efflux system component
MMPRNFRDAAWAVAIINLAYFWIEIAVALHIGSVSLFADSVDFLEDASLNFLILFALGWNPRARANAGMILAAILLAPSAATLWMMWRKFLAPLPPAPTPLSLTALGALALNLFCAVLLTAFRHHSGSLSKAAFLSARNDVLANTAIIAAAGVTAAYPSGWPDLVVGIGIMALNMDAARAVYRAARSERIAAQPWGTARGIPYPQRKGPHRVRPKFREETPRRRTTLRRATAVSRCNI